MNLLAVVALFLVGLFLSALFSGSETGFYRVTRVRLVLDAKSGDWVARLLLWLTNNPALFVATTLIGNNFANYLTSMAVVLGVSLFSVGSNAAEIAATVIVSPVVFIYGELLPKNLFFRAPNRLLRRGGPLFLIAAALFAPVSAVLWGLGWMLQSLIGEAPLRVRLTLAAQELRQVLREGRDAGVLQPTQQHLAQSLFSIASESVGKSSHSPAKVTATRLGDLKADFLALARKRRVSSAPVAEQSGQWIGYVRIVDLYLSSSDTIDDVRPLHEVGEKESHLAALIRLQSENEEMARVVGANGKTTGFVYANELAAPLFSEA